LARRGPTGQLRLFGAPPPFILLGGSNILGVVRKTRVQKMHRENEIAFRPHWRGGGWS
jgi:hypothetical protein